MARENGLPLASSGGPSRASSAEGAGPWRSVPFVPALLAYYKQLLRHNVFSRTFGTGLTAHWRRVIGDSIVRITNLSQQFYDLPKLHPNEQWDEREKN